MDALATTEELLQSAPSTARPAAVLRQISAASDGPALLPNSAISTGSVWTTTAANIQASNFIFVVDTSAPVLSAVAVWTVVLPGMMDVGWDDAGDIVRC